MRITQPSQPSMMKSIMKFIMKFIKSISLLVITSSLCVFLMGCGSIFRNRRDEFVKDSRFASVRTDVEMINHICGPSRGKFDFIAGAYPLLVFPVVDLPFAVVRDVLWYPYDAHHASKNKQDEAFWRNVLDTGEGTPEEGAKRMSSLTDEMLYWPLHYKFTNGPHAKIKSPQALDIIVKASVMSNRERVLYSASGYPLLTEEHCVMLYDWQERNPKSYSASIIRANLVSVSAMPLPLLLMLVEMNEDASQINAIKSNRLPLPMVTNLVGELALSTNWTTKAFVASHPVTSSEQLDILAREGLTQISQRDIPYVCDVVARNPKTSLQTLQMLGEQKDLLRMYRGLGSNPKTPKDILLRIIDCPYGATRYEPIKAVAANPNLPIEKIMEYASLDSSYLHEELCKNPSLPIELIQSFSTNKEVRVRAAIASNPSTPLDVLQQLAKERDWYVIDHVVKNPNTTDEMLEGILKAGWTSEALPEIERRKLQKSENL